MPRQNPRRKSARWLYIAAAVGSLGPLTLKAPAAITFVQNSGTNWTVGNGDLTMVFNPSGSNITSLELAGSTTNLLDPANSQIYDELAKSGLNSGTLSSGYQKTSNYVDVYTNTQSSATNPFTYQIHYVMFNNDPAIHMYEVVNHSATDIAGSYGQGQFLARVNPSYFYNTYQDNVSPTSPGAHTATLNNYSSQSTAQAQAGRNVQDATYDLTGSGLNGDFGTNFYTKYDYSSYTQFWQAQTEYGPNYAISTVIPSTESMTGGPTKQNLMFTNNIDMVEFLSGHYSGSADPYVPAQGVDSSRLFGPYVFRVTPTNNETGSQLYQDAVNSIPSYKSLYDTESTLISNGYVPSTQRGSLLISAANSAGWNANTMDNTVVLSDQFKNTQSTTNGNQYWAQLPTSGNVSMSGIVPGTYRLTLYELGQWGETRVDGVKVAANTVMMPQKLKFTPENFGSAAPIWTIGTPDRSSHEFLNGHNAAGQDQRQFYGAYDYWAEEQALGNPGKVVYYATAVGSTPATNDPNKWIANQWQKFDPGLYDAANGTSDNYTNTAPAYVTAGGGPGTYAGLPWEVHFTATAAQLAQGQYAVLSIGLAATEASLIVSLNGHSEIWHYSNATDAMVRSGDAGYYQFLAFQFPTADLNAAGLDNDLTLSVSTTDGEEYDALRMEITNTSAAPTTTGWHDYEYITGTNSQIAADNTQGLTLSETIVPEPTALGAMSLTGLLALKRRRRRE